MDTSESFRTFAVVNPRSSNGRTAKRWSEISRVIRRSLGAEFDYRFTSRPLEAIPITRKAILDGYEMVITVGGDGTNNESLNGFFDEDGQVLNPDVVFGVLPSGTGGDFRKALRIPAELEAAAARLGGRETRNIDVGLLEYTDPEGRPARRHFINITSFGVGGVVDDYVNRSTKMLGGKASFFIGSLKALLTYRNQTIRLRLDDFYDEQLVVNNVAVANGQYFGGGMWVAPEADLSDGLFDVVVFGDLTKAEFVGLSRLIYAGTHLSHPKISHTRASRVIAESAETVLIDMDGEQPGRLPATLTVVPSAVRLKV